MLSSVTRWFERMGAILDLGYRTIVAPVLHAAAFGRDTHLTDAGGQTRRILYSPPEYSDAFDRVRSRAVGKGPRKPKISAATVRVLVRVLSVIAGGVALLVALGYIVPFFHAVPVVVLCLLPLGFLADRLRIPPSCTREQVRDAWLNEGLCPACGHGLAVSSGVDVPTDARCMECGAAWFMPE